MLEKTLASYVKLALAGYKVHSISRKGVGGFPDLLIQCPRSRVLFAELKIVTPRVDGTFSLGTRPDQCIWLNTWTRYGGIGMVIFTSEILWEKQFKTMFVYMPQEPSHWLTASSQSFSFSPTILMRVFTGPESFRTWIETL